MGSLVPLLLCTAPLPIALSVNDLVWVSLTVHGAPSIHRSSDESIVPCSVWIFIIGLLLLAEFDALETTCRGLAQDKVLSAIGAAQCPTEEP